MTLVQVQVNRVCETLYEVEEKAIIEAPVKSQAKVENKTLRKRLAEVKVRATLADMLVVVEVDILWHKLSMVKTLNGGGHTCLQSNTGGCPGTKTH